MWEATQASIQRRVQRPLEEYRRVRTSHGVIFLAYEPSKRYLERTLPPEQNYVAMFTAGATGCLASSVVRVPTEVIKTRAQTGNKVQSLGGILRASGIAGLFVGYGSFLIRDLPFDAIEFSLYDEAKIASPSGEDERWAKSVAWRRLL